MTTTTIRVSQRTRQRLASLSEESGKPMTAVVDEALDALDRRRFFDGFNTRYGELRGDPRAWRDIEVERAHEAGSLLDASE